MLSEETHSKRWSEVMSMMAIRLMPSATRRCATARPIPEAAPRGFSVQMVLTQGWRAQRRGRGCTCNKGDAAKWLVWMFDNECITYLSGGNSGILSSSGILLVLR